MTLDQFSDVPLYLQLAAVLREKIEKGVIAPRTPVPSVKALVQEHNVARGTAERAVEVLRSEGLVRTVPGKGVFVLLPEERGR